ncbi:MAG: hypothetical protein GF317_17845 [Candidatus Lokiarchaeota archaeon]|nr:hypothetical protein [Candidatus Lokiarchaeota archaeon]MBD3201376.1 hypothetical protein [Candidatus Lokiarchaeota archaeon]
MNVDPETAVYNLMQKDPTIIAAAVLQGRKDIIFQTDNWDISPDIDKVISSWIGKNAQFIKISGVKYSMLQCTDERMAATSIKGEGSIIAAKDDEHKLIAYVSPDGDMRGAMMDTARAVAEMSSKESYMDEGDQLGSGTPAPATGGGANIDPQLKGEIQTFLEWINDNEGLVGYIRYYLQQENGQIISQLAQVYNELRSIFGV